MNELTTTEAYKLGFAVKLANLGITPSMVEQALEKNAFLGVGAAIKAVEEVLHTVPSVAKLGIGALGVVPVAVGGTLGYTSGRAEGPEQPDIDAMKAEERVNIARRALRALKRQQGLL